MGDGLDEVMMADFWLGAEQAVQADHPNLNYKAGRPDKKPEDRWQLQFHRSRHMIRGLFTGNGCGKSTSAAIEADYWLQGNHPYQFTPSLPVKVFWVTLYYKQMAELRDQLEATALTPGFKYQNAEHRYVWKNHSTLTIISNDGSWEGVQGTPPDLVIIDEECDQKLWLELRMRRRAATRTRYVISATATKGKRWMFHQIYNPWLLHHRKLGLCEEEAMRYQSHPRIWCWPKGGIEDNPAAQPDDLDNYNDALVLASPQERQVRLHGGFADFNASPIFDHDKLRIMEEKNVEQEIIGVSGWFTEIPRGERLTNEDHDTVQFNPGMPDPNGRGWVKIYELPTADNYATGADFGYGLESGDYDAACVVRQSTGRQVAVAYGHWGNDAFAWLLWKLCVWYRDALLVGERQVGLPILRKVYDDYGYRRLYFEKDANHAAIRFSDELGHHRHAGDLTIPYLAMAIKPTDERTGKVTDSEVWLSDPETIDQHRQFELRPRSDRVALTAARNSQLKQSAPSGVHDDLVLAMGYAWMGIRELPRFAPPPKAIVIGSAADILKHDQIKDRPT